MPLHKDCPMVEIPEDAWVQALTDALGFPNTGEGAPYVREGTRVYITAPVTQGQVDAVMKSLTPEAMNQAKIDWQAGMVVDELDQPATLRQVQDMITKAMEAKR